LAKKTVVGASGSLLESVRSEMFVLRRGYGNPLPIYKDGMLPFLF